MRKAKTFCYVSVGILALALAFHLGARSARASYVPPGETGIVGTTPGEVLLDNGEVWRVDWGGSEWYHGPRLDAPVPVSEIRFWEAWIVVTRTNDVWVEGSGPTWVHVGPPPGVTATESSTWGRVKARFGEDSK